MIVPTSSCPLQLRRSVLLALVCAALRPSLTLSLVPRNSGHHRGKGGGSGVGSGFGPSSVSGSGDNGGYRQMRAGINTLAASQKGRRYMRLHLKLGDWFGSRAIQKIDYSSLEGAAQEAGRWALKGEVPQKSEQGYDIATFAGGCFWGLELAFQRVPGVVATSVGYTQGGVDQPTYDEVCSAETGHTEAVQVFYDPNLVTYEQLLSVFWGRINPLTLNRQGGDIGTQYRTGVYAHTPEQYAAALESVRLEQQKYDKPIVTEIMPAKVYWPAEGYHQQYLSTGGRFGAPQSAAKNCTDPIRCYG